MVKSVIKITAVLLIVVFTTTTIALSAPDFIYRLRIPQEYGKVKERWKKTDEHGFKKNGLSRMSDKQSVSIRPRSFQDENSELNQCQSVDNDRTVIIVEDAHDNFGVQKNIAEIIQALLPQITLDRNTPHNFVTPLNRGEVLDSDVPLNKGGAQRAGDVTDLQDDFIIGVEGAIGDVPVDMFRKYPILEARELASEKMVKKGYLTGSEHAAISCQYPIELWGVEDEGLFYDDFKQFFAVSSLKSEMEDCIEAIDDALACLKQKLFNSDLKSFDEICMRYEKQKMDLNEYILKLFKIGEKNNIDMFEYAQLQLFKEIALLSACLKKNELENEIKNITEKLGSEFKDFNPSLNTTETCGNGELQDSEVPIIKGGTPCSAGGYAEGRCMLRSHQIETKNYQLISQLYNYAIEKGIDVRRKYPHIQRKIILEHKYALLDMAVLSSEVNNLRFDIALKLAKNSDEKSLVQIQDYLERLERVFTLKGTRDDVEYVFGKDVNIPNAHLYREGKLNSHGLLNKRSKLGAGDVMNLIISDLISIAEKHSINFHLSNKFSNLRKILPSVKKFYLLAEEREKAMIENLIKKMDKESKSSGVLVVGGYHSEGVARMLKEKNISYVTITPHIQDIVDRTGYIDRMIGNLVPLAPHLTSYITFSQINGLATAVGNIEAAVKIKKGFSHYWQHEIYKKFNFVARLEAIKEHIKDPYIQKVADAIFELKKEIKEDVTEQEGLMLSPDMLETAIYAAIHDKNMVHRLRDIIGRAAKDQSKKIGVIQIYDNVPSYLTPTVPKNEWEKALNELGGPIVDISMESHLIEMDFFATAMGKGGLGILESDTGEGYAKEGVKACLMMPMYERMIVPVTDPRHAVHASHKRQILEGEMTFYDRRIVDPNNRINIRTFMDEPEQVQFLELDQNPAKPIKILTETVTDEHGRQVERQVKITVELWDGQRHGFRPYDVAVFVISRGGTPAFLFACEEVNDILYTEDNAKRLNQQVLMGKAVPSLMKKMGIRPSIFRLNEAHTVVAMSEMKQDPYFKDVTYVFTNHTPIDAGMARYGNQDWFDRLGLPAEYRDNFIHKGMLDFSYAAMSLADVVNGVSNRHAEILRKMFPEFAYKIKGIMNGTGQFWKSDAIVAAEAAEEKLTPQKLWDIHQEDKQKLGNIIELRERGIKIDLNEPVVMAIRRIDHYKQQYPMLKDIIKALCQDKGVKTTVVLDGQELELEGLGITIVLGGIIVNPFDPTLQHWVREFLSWMQDPALKGRFIFISGNDIELMKAAASGCDSWIEMPRPDEEACGTSGMRAVTNGNPTIGFEGGWSLEWIREYIPKKEGEAVGYGNGFFIEKNSPKSLYDKLKIISDLYYKWRDEGDTEWIELRRKVYKDAQALDIGNMVKRYVLEVFLPAKRERKKREQERLEKERLKKEVEWAGDVRPSTAMFHEITLGDEFEVSGVIKLNSGREFIDEVLAEICWSGGEWDKQPITMTKVKQIDENSFRFTGVITPTACGEYGYKVRFSLPKIGKVQWVPDGFGNQGRFVVVEKKEPASSDMKNGKNGFSEFYAFGAFFIIGIIVDLVLGNQLFLFSSIGLSFDLLRLLYQNLRLFPVPISVTKLILKGKDIKQVKIPFLQFAAEHRSSGDGFSDKKHQPPFGSNIDEQIAFYLKHLKEITGDDIVNEDVTLLHEKIRKPFKIISRQTQLKNELDILDKILSQPVTSQLGRVIFRHAYLLDSEQRDILRTAVLINHTESFLGRSQSEDDKIYVSEVLEKILIKWGYSENQRRLILNLISTVPYVWSLGGDSTITAKEFEDHIKTVLGSREINKECEIFLRMLGIFSYVLTIQSGDHFVSDGSYFPTLMGIMREPHVPDSIKDLSGYLYFIGKSGAAQELERLEESTKEEDNEFLQLIDCALKLRNKAVFLQDKGFCNFEDDSIRERHCDCLLDILTYVTPEKRVELSEIVAWAEDIIEQEEQKKEVWDLFISRVREAALKNGFYPEGQRLRLVIKGIELFLEDCIFETEGELNDFSWDDFRYYDLPEDDEENVYHGRRAASTSIRLFLEEKLPVVFGVKDKESDNYVLNFTKDLIKSGKNSFRPSIDEAGKIKRNFYNIIIQSKRRSSCFKIRDDGSFFAEYDIPASDIDEIYIFNKRLGKFMVFSLLLRKIISDISAVPQNDIEQQGEKIIDMLFGKVEEKEEDDTPDRWKKETRSWDEIMRDEPWKAFHFAGVPDNGLLWPYEVVSDDEPITKETVIKGKKVGIISTRLAGLDGVSQEANKWAEILHNKGAEVFYYSGETKTPDFIPAERGITFPPAHFLDEEIQELHERIFSPHDIYESYIEKINTLKNQIKENLRKFLIDNEIDIMITENIMAYPGNFPLALAVIELQEELAAEGIDIKRIDHNHDFAWERDRFKKLPRLYIEKMIKRLVKSTSKSTKSVVINSFQQDILRRHFGIHADIAPNVMNFEKEPEIDPKILEYFRKHYNIAKDDWLFLLPVRPVGRKQLELAFKQIRKIMDKEPGRKIHVMVTHAAGDEGYTYWQELKMEAEALGINLIDAGENNEIGPQDGQFDLGVAYSACDMVFYTSEIEGWGNAWLETVYYKKPVCIYPYPVYKQDIKLCGAQCIEIEGASDEAADKIINLLYSPQDLEAMVKHNYKCGKEYFSYPVIEELLQSLIYDLFYPDEKELEVEPVYQYEQDVNNYINELYDIIGKKRIQVSKIMSLDNFMVQMYKKNIRKALYALDEIFVDYCKEEGSEVINRLAIKTLQPRDYDILRAAILLGNTGEFMSNTLKGAGEKEVFSVLKGLLRLREFSHNETIIIYNLIRNKMLLSQLSNGQITDQEFELCISNALGREITIKEREYFLRVLAIFNYIYLYASDVDFKSDGFRKYFRVIREKTGIDLPLSVSMEDLKWFFWFWDNKEALNELKYLQTGDWKKFERYLNLLYKALLYRKRLLLLEKEGLFLMDDLDVYEKNQIEPLLLFYRYYNEYQMTYFEKKMDLIEIFINQIEAGKWELLKNRGEKIKSSLKDFCFKDEEELENCLNTIPNIEDLASDIPFDEEKYAYRGRRVSIDDLKTIVFYGMRRELMSGTFDKRFYVSTNPEGEIGTAFYPHGKDYANKDFYSIIYQIDRPNCSIQQKGSVYYTEEDIKPENVLKIFMFDKEERRFIEICPIINKIIAESMVGKSKESDVQSLTDIRESDGSIDEDKDDIPPHLASLNAYDLESHKDLRAYLKDARQIQIYGEEIEGAEFNQEYFQTLKSIVKRLPEDIKIILVEHNHGPPDSIEQRLLFYHIDTRRWIFSHAGTRGGTGKFIYLPKISFLELAETKSGKNFLRKLIYDEIIHVNEKMAGTWTEDFHQKEDEPLRNFLLYYFKYRLYKRPKEIREPIHIMRSINQEIKRIGAVIEDIEPILDEIRVIKKMKVKKGVWYKNKRDKIIESLSATKEKLGQPIKVKAKINAINIIEDVIAELGSDSFDNVLSRLGRGGNSARSQLKKYFYWLVSSRDRLIIKLRDKYNFYDLMKYEDDVLDYKPDKETEKQFIKEFKKWRNSFEGQTAGALDRVIKFYNIWHSCGERKPPSLAKLSHVIDDNEVKTAVEKITKFNKRFDKLSAYEKWKVIRENKQQMTHSEEKLIRALALTPQWYFRAIVPRQTREYIAMRGNSGAFGTDWLHNKSAINIEYTGDGSQKDYFLKGDYNFKYNKKPSIEMAIINLATYTDKTKKFYRFILKDNKDKFWSEYADAMQTRELREHISRRDKQVYTLRYKDAGGKKQNEKWIVLKDSLTEKPFALFRNIGDDDIIKPKPPIENFKEAVDLLVTSVAQSLDAGNSKRESDINGQDVKDEEIMPGQEEIKKKLSRQIKLFDEDAEGKQEEYYRHFEGIKVKCEVGVKMDEVHWHILEQALREVKERSFGLFIEFEEKIGEYILIAQDGKGDNVNDKILRIPFTQIDNVIKNINPKMKQMSFWKLKKEIIEYGLWHESKSAQEIALIATGRFKSQFLEIIKEDLLFDVTNVDSPLVVFVKEVYWQLLGYIILPNIFTKDELSQDAKKYFNDEKFREIFDSLIIRDDTESYLKAALLVTLRNLNSRAVLMQDNKYQNITKRCVEIGDENLDLLWNVFAEPLSILKGFSEKQSFDSIMYDSVCNAIVKSVHDTGIMSENTHMRAHQIVKNESYIAREVLGEEAIKYKKNKGGEIILNVFVHRDFKHSREYTYIKKIFDVEMSQMPGILINFVSNINDAHIVLGFDETEELYGTNVFYFSKDNFTKFMKQVIFFHYAFNSILLAALSKKGDMQVDLNGLPLANLLKVDFNNIAEEFVKYMEDSIARYIKTRQIAVAA